MGMYDEATIYYQMSIDILPSWQSNSAQWWLNLIQGKFEDALIFAQRNVELYPEDNRSHLELARTYAHMGKYEMALEIYDTWYSMYDENLLDVIDYNTFSDEYKFLLIHTGTDVKRGQELVNKKLEDLYKLQEEDGFNYAGGQYYDLMRLNSLMGNKEEALKFLKKLEKADFAFGSISWAMVDPLLEDVRDEPEFMAAIERGWERRWELQEQVRKIEAEEDLIAISKR